MLYYIRCHILVLRRLVVGVSTDGFIVMEVHGGTNRVSNNLVGNIIHQPNPYWEVYVNGLESKTFFIVR